MKNESDYENIVNPRVEGILPLLLITYFGLPSLFIFLVIAVYLQIKSISI